MRRPGAARPSLVRRTVTGRSRFFHPRRRGLRDSSLGSSGQLGREERSMRWMRSSSVRMGAVALALAAVAAVVVSSAVGGKDKGRESLQKVNHVVVIYEENHSFDNLYGGWEGVNGRSNAPAAQTKQIGQNGLLYTCLLQNDVNLKSPPLPADCTDTSSGTAFSSHFKNAPF